MNQEIIIFIQQYVEWGIFSLGCIAVVTLWRMNGYLKKLNRLLAGMSGKIHDYFTAITEEENDPPASTNEKQQYHTVQRDENSKNKGNSKEEEAVIQAVLKEYFS